MVIEMENKVYRAAIYCRLSKEDGDKAESNSIGSQRDYCEAYIQKHEDITLVREPIVDDGVSGISFERAGFKVLEEEIRTGKINCVVVRDLSRFSRNYIDAGRYLEKIFPSLGIRFIAINDHYDSLTSDPQSDAFMLPFKNLINDTYCKDISVKIRSSLEIKRKNGEYVGSFCPYGYKRDEKSRHKLVVDENVSEYVQLIFSLFKDGISIGKIAEKFTKMGIATPLEYKRSIGVNFETAFKKSETSKWEYNTVKRILCNEVYMGVLIQGKRGTPNYKVRVMKNKDESEWIKVENAHESLVSKEDFHAVQNLLQRDMRSLLSKDSQNILSGFLFCADCGATMIRKSVSSNGKKYIYYVCSNHKNNKTCSSHTIPVNDIEEKVFTAIHDQVKLVAHLEKTIAMIEELPYKERRVFDYEKQIKNLELEMERYQRLKLRLYEDYTDKIISKNDFLEFGNTYTNMMEEKEKTIKCLRNEMEQAIDLGMAAKNWVTQFNEVENKFSTSASVISPLQASEITGLKYENIKGLNRRVLMALVDRIKIYEDHMIEIVFKYIDEYQYVMEYVANFNKEIS
ncbi:MAG: recombinase family protein [Eubacteriales bacterium]